MTGCKKCEYTGFSFARIPCECSDSASQIEINQTCTIRMYHEKDLLTMEDQYTVFATRYPGPGRWRFDSTLESGITEELVQRFKNIDLKLFEKKFVALRECHVVPLFEIDGTLKEGVKAE